MTFLLSAILASIFATTITDVSEPDKNERTYVYVTKQVHDEQQASFKAMLDEIGTNLSLSEVHDTSRIKAQTRAVAAKHMPCESTDVEERNWCKEQRDELTRRLYAGVPKSEVFKEKSITAFNEKINNREIYVRHNGLFWENVSTERNNNQERINIDGFLAIVCYMGIAFFFFSVIKDYIDENKQEVENVVITAYSMIFKHYIAVIITFIIVLYPLLLLSFIL